MVFDVVDAVKDQVDATGSYWFLFVFTSHFLHVFFQP